RILGELLYPIAQLRRVNVQVLRCLHIGHASVLDQAHSLKLELASKLPSLHDPPPVPSKHLTRCLRNRVQAKAPASRGVRVDYLPGGKLLHRRLPNRAALSRVLGSLWTKRRFVLLGRFPSTSRQPLSWSRLKGVRLAFICCEKIKPWKRKTFGVRR